MSWRAFICAACMAATASQESGGASGFRFRRRLCSSSELEGDCDRARLLAFCFFAFLLGASSELEADSDCAAFLLLVFDFFALFAFLGASSELEGDSESAAFLLLVLCFLRGDEVGESSKSFCCRSPSR